MVPVPVLVLAFVIAMTMVLHRVVVALDHHIASWRKWAMMPVSVRFAPVPASVVPVAVVSVPALAVMIRIIPGVDGGADCRAYTCAHQGAITTPQSRPQGAAGGPSDCTADGGVSVQVARHRRCR
eukprot:Anaeramoba_flamelloidesa573566_10.p2 GENE.a573566_10~~a573566_10.p2  ORF type:complete len:125 (-),score=5.26 a573566_10:56-430(-)